MKTILQILHSLNKRLASYPKIRSELKKLLFFILPNSVIYFLKETITVNSHNPSKQDQSEPILTNLELSFYNKLLDEYKNNFR